MAKSDLEDKSIRWMCRKGSVVVRTLKVSKKSLYSMLSVIFSQWRDRRMGVVWLDLGTLTIAWAREFWICWSRVIWDSAGYDKESYSSQAWSEQWKWRWWKLFWNRGMEGYGEADEYGNYSFLLFFFTAAHKHKQLTAKIHSKIWRQMRSGQKRWGFEQSECC